MNNYPPGITDSTFSDMTINDELMEEIYNWYDLEPDIDKEGQELLFDELPEKRQQKLIERYIKKFGSTGENF